MSGPESPESRPAGLFADSAAEKMVMTQYRCWMAGYSTRDIACWEIAWNALAHDVGLAPARRLYGEFQGFVRTILQVARRDVGRRPAACGCLCDDEMRVLALVEAAQRGRTDQMLGLVNDLVGHCEGGPLVDAGRSLARALTVCDVRLGTASLKPGMRKDGCDRPALLH